MKDGQVLKRIKIKFVHGSYAICMTLIRVAQHNWWNEKWASEWLETEVCVCSRMRKSSNFILKIILYRCDDLCVRASNDYANIAEQANQFWHLVLFLLCCVKEFRCCYSFRVHVYDCLISIGDSILTTFVTLNLFIIDERGWWLTRILLSIIYFGLVIPLNFFLSLCVTAKA